MKRCQGLFTTQNTKSSSARERQRGSLQNEKGEIKAEFIKETTVRKDSVERELLGALSCRKKGTYSRDLFFPVLNQNTLMRTERCRGSPPENHT